MSKLVKCKSCGNDIASSAKTCPNCGAKNKKPIYKKVWFWILIVIVVIGIAGAAGGGSSSSKKDGTDKDTKVTETKKEKYEMVQEPVMTKDDFGTVHIEGTIKNNSGKEASYIQITFKLFDKDGNQVGTAIDNLNNLETDGTWKFKATGFDSDKVVDSFKLGEVTGF